jgi:predicted nucleic acid-binding protein
MILVDTSVVIDFLRSSDVSILDAILEHDAAICGVTRAEVLHGARDGNHRQSLIAALDLFGSAPLPESIWDVVGQNLAELRASGVTVPLADAVIATVAASNGVALWTRDKHFERIQQVMPALQLFKEQA